MNTKQQIINEIKNGEKKDYYQACIKKDITFDIVVDNVKYEITAGGDEPLPTCVNSYAACGATAWRIPSILPGICNEKHEFTSEELEFIWAEEWAEEKAKWIAELISLIPANITEDQRNDAIKWIKSGAADFEEAKNMWKTYLFSLIPANIIGDQRDSAIKWIKSGTATIEEIESMKPWEPATADDDILEALGI